ncbi:MAG: methyl-accepting chemotaxis protein [Burkholderiales bacterium]|nr:methyl-accepting chemotaxis protein [Burkholderiales bacterium]
MVSDPTGLSLPHGSAPDAGVAAAQSEAPGLAAQRDAMPAAYRPLSRRAWASIGAAFVALSLAVILFALDKRQHEHALTRRIGSAELQMLGQRIVATSQRASLGDAAAIDQLQLARKQFTARLGSIGAHAPAVFSTTAAAEIARTWHDAEAHIARMLAPSGGGESAEADPAHAERRAVAGEIARAGELLLLQSSRLAAPAADDLGRVLIWSASAAAAAALFLLGFAARTVRNDAMRAAETNREAVAQTRRANQRTQRAILKLLDEISDLAQGDLTVHANIGDEQTGALADAVNFAVTELRRLVGSINAATGELARRCAEAQTITGELLNAAQRESQRVVAANAAVAGIVASIIRVSQRAAESAGVAQVSLAAAAEGRQAVDHAIEGMNRMRERFQVAAKRIKHLGESAQEIFEIVDLISDLSERTNVLALNAAIQAHAGGSAGRGYDRVADEVQALAERSAQATHRIRAIVQTIQADTQDATLAMERSTQEVVDQARLADAAGQSLARIDQVSRKLAVLTDRISTATSEQTEAAESVRSHMSDILRITALSAGAARRSADSSARLAALAAALKQSVAGFKLS